MPVSRPSADQVRVFRTAAEFRSWLAAHHASAAELFVGFYRKASDKPAMSYDQAVDEALCFGWIDGITFRIDDQLRTMRFTPRRKGSNWSAVNIARANRLTAEGRMHPAGTRAFEARDRRPNPYSYENAPRELPPEMVERLQANAAAWRSWHAETPSYRRTVSFWILSAKREETRERRLATLMADAAAGRRIKALA